MTNPTGAERYLDDRLTDPVYREVYEAALAEIRRAGPRINVSAARRFAEGYRSEGMRTAARAIDDLLDRIEHLEQQLADATTDSERLRRQQSVDTEPKGQ